MIMAEDPKNPGVVEETEEKLVTEKSGTHHNPANKPAKVLLLSITIAVILLLGIGGWFVFTHFFASHDAENKAKTAQVEDEKEKHPESNVFLAIPEVLVNLRSTKPKGNVLRTTLMLQIYAKEDESKIKEFIPIILDQLLSYLRDQAISDLEGPGLERMRQALLIRINNVIHPLRVHRVIIKDFIIQ